MQVKDPEKILTIHISDKGLICRIYNELSEFNSKKQKANPYPQNQSNLKMGKRHKHTFHRRGHTDGK